MPSLSPSIQLPARYRGASNVLVLIKAGWNRAAKSKKQWKKETRLEHFSHLPLEQPVGFGCGFCYRSYLGSRPGLHQVSHANAEKTGHQRRFYYRRLKSYCIYLLPKRIVNALEVSDAGSGATSCNPGRSKKVNDGLSANYRCASR